MVKKKIPKKQGSCLTKLVAGNLSSFGLKQEGTIKGEMNFRNIVVQDEPNCDQLEEFDPTKGVTLLGLKEAMIESLLEGETEEFKGCISILLKLISYDYIVEETGITRPTLYRMTGLNSNPTLENISKIMNFIENEIKRSVT